MASHNVYMPGLVQIRPQYSIGAAGEPERTAVENVLWFQGATLSNFPLTTASLTVIQDTFDAHWPVMWQYIGQEAYQYVGSIVTDWSVDTGITLPENTGLAPTDGLGAGDMAANVAMLLSYVAPSMPRYKGGHGRTYLPFCSSTYLQTPWEWQNARVEDVAGGWSTMSTAMLGISSSDGGGFNQVVFRNKTNPLTAAVHDITSVNVGSVPASQRRRLRAVSRKK
jgi:hypothetical protein